MGKVGAGNEMFHLPIIHLLTKSQICCSYCDTLWCPEVFFSFPFLSVPYTYPLHRIKQTSTVWLPVIRHNNLSFLDPYHKTGFPYISSVQGWWSAITALLSFQTLSSSRDCRSDTSNCAACFFVSVGFWATSAQSRAAEVLATRTNNSLPG